MSKTFKYTCILSKEVGKQSSELRMKLIQKGGVRLYITQQWEVWDYIQWRVVCDFTSHHNEKCETTFNEGWCVTVHHITMRSLRLYSMKGCVLLYIGTWSCKTHCNGCMDVAWASFWGKAGAGNLVFFHVKWLRPAMKGTSCVCGGCGCALEPVRIGSSSVFCNEWLFMRA